MAYAYGILSIASYLIYAYAAIFRLLADARKYVHADVYQTSQATDKFAKIVLNAMSGPLLLSPKVYSKPCLSFSSTLQSHGPNPVCLRL